jgi:putative ABC transport system permease protein
MIKNYIQVAMRNLRRHKFFSFINIFGLAISMSVCLGIIMLVADQLTYDRYNTKRDRIYRVITRNLNPDGSSSGNDYSTSPQIVAQAMLEDYTGISKAVRIRRGFGNNWLELDPGRDINIPLSGFFVDEDALDVFEYELELGDPETALKDPYSVVLSNKAAKKLFSTNNPVGEVIKVGKLGEYKVTGVLKETNHKSHIVFEGLASYSTIKSLEADSTFSSSDSGWDNFTAGWVYLLLEEGQSPVEIERHLNDYANKQQASKAANKDERKIQFYLQNLSSITPGGFINNPIGPFMPMIFVYFFGGLALIIMITSCFNYTNLSIARALTRAKEIGIRKVNGAFRYQIFAQFISEAVIMAVFALCLALLFLLAVKPFMLNLRFAQALRWDLEGNIYVYSVFIVFSICIGLLAGFFPAVILSKFQPVKVFKNVGGSIKLFSKMGLRKSLLVIQFTLSLIFILSVLLLYNQLQLFVKADHGFDMANKINVRLNNTSYTALKEQLGSYSTIQSIAAASHIPATGVTYGDNFKKTLGDKEGTPLDYFVVDEGYLENMNIPLIAGKNFDALAGEKNKSSIIINEEAVKTLQFSTAHDAIGEFIYLESDSSKHEIIGVIKNYNHQMMMSKVEAMALKYNPDQFNIIQIKYTGSREDAIKNIEAAWAKINASSKLDYRDFEEEVRSFYKTVFSDFVSIIGVIAFMAIIISCLGLLGMATYATETRLKEISIRKVLGSSNLALVLLLSKSFIFLLIIAIALAVPAAWFINNLWLQLIAYRTELSIGVIGCGILVLIILGGLTIGSQTIRAAWANPVDNLKND